METTRPPAVRTLRTAFLLALILAYAVIAAVTFVVFSAAAGNLSDRYAERYSVAQSELEKNRIRSIVDRELALSLKLGDDPAIRAWMRAEDDEALKAAALEQLESYRRLFRDGAYFLAIASSGSYYVRTPDSSELRKTALKADSPDDRWFYNLLSTEAAYELNVDHNVLLAENRVWINVIVRDVRGKAIGVAGCGLDLTAFLSALLDRPASGVSTVIVDAEGTLLAYQDRDLVARNAEAMNDDVKADIYGFLPDVADRRALRTALQSAKDGGSPAVLRVKFQGRRELCAVSALSELGWYDLIFVDAGSVIGPADFIPIASVTLLALLAVAAIMLALTNRLVLSPIAKLTEATSRIAGGSYDLALPEGSDEIGRLAVSFRSMAEKVKDYTLGLQTLVEERTAELRKANADLESSRGAILESIEYAKLIQDSINPSVAALDSRLDGYFAAVRQRDLVGGDFFFFKTVEDGFCLAVADCTGHGVPGAFMTMLVKAHLDRVAEALPDAHPSAMLAELDRLVVESLAAETESAHLENGLDIALCRYRTSTDTLRFAGAGLPLFAWRADVAEFPASRAHLGFSGGRRKKEFVDHAIPAASAHRFYLATDGVLDLPGGDRGLPFGKTRLRRLIADIAPLSFADAEARSLDAFTAWRAGRGQRDDLTFVGFALRPPKEA